MTSHTSTFKKITGSIIIIIGVGLGIFSVVQLTSGGFWLSSVLLGVALVVGGYAVLSGAKAPAIIRDLTSNFKRTK